MATYLQWSRSKSVRRVTWVCGPEPVLVREVVAAHRGDAPPGQCTALWAGEAPERDIWDQLLADPPPGGRRAVVYGAERLQATQNVALLASDGADTAYTVFVSAEPDFARADGKLAPHLAALQSSKAGQLVRCCAPSSETDRTALVASWWPGATDILAARVLARCGSLERAWLACEQARLAGLQPVPSAADALCPGEDGGDFTDLITAGDKRAAMAAAAHLGDSLGAAIGLLASRLLIAEQIAAEVRGGMPPREAAGRLRIDRYVAGKVIPYLGAYPPGRVRSCRRALAAAESAWKSGIRAGVAESLVASW